MTDLDTDVKALFDQRLSGFTAPAPRAPRTRRPVRNLVAAGAGALVLAGGAFVLDVNSVAASTGLDCAGFPTKVQAWAQSHRFAFWTDHSAARAELAKMVADSGCSPHDGQHDSTHHQSGQHH